MHFEFSTLLAYSPRGNSHSAILSKKWLGACKNGNQSFGDILSTRLKHHDMVKYFQDSILIPIPRSSPIKPGSVFPSKIIAESLLEKNIGNSVIECLKRTKAIPKSSSQYNADLRNSVDTHLESLNVDLELIIEPNLILIDDVLTQGRTAMACAMLLQKAYPDKTIKIFCPFRTRSFQEIENFESPDNGIMILSPNRKVILPD